MDTMRAIGGKDAMTCHSKCRQKFDFTAMPSSLAVLANFSSSWRKDSGRDLHRPDRQTEPQKTVPNGTVSEVQACHEE